MSKELFINFMREKGVELTHADVDHFVFMAKSLLEDLSDDAEIALALAEHQLYGYTHASKGYSLSSLVDDMGLTQDEWDRIDKSSVGLNADEVDEVDNHLNNGQILG